MKHSFLVLLLVFAPSMFGQGSKMASLIENISTQSPSLGLGVGLAQHAEGFTVPRFTVAANNLFGLGLGVYLTPEFRSGVTFLEDGTNYYFRMPMGISFEFGNLGAFLGADLISAAAGKNLRKEIGIIYHVPSVPVDLRLGYSSYVGPTLGVGYRMSISK
ncbi:MAG: hypothetical protein QNL67_03660 [Cryomorphaceae bacterium]